jgi:SAM-dependent methyltransferase
MEIFALHAAAESALESGLLAHLVARPSRAEEAAAALGLDARGVSLVLEVLRTRGLIEADEGRYLIPPRLRRELEGPGGNVPLNSTVWAGTPKLVRSGETLFRGHVGARGAAYSEVVARLGALFEISANTLARALAPDLPADARILDVGSGSGVWSLALLAHRGEAWVTALDLEPVVPRFEEAARARGLTERVDILAGDYFTVEVPRGAFDVIVIANVLHLETPERAVALLARLVPSLRPRGRVVIVDAFPSLDGDGTTRHAAYALHLGLRVPGAYPHLESTVRRWLAERAFDEVERVPLEDEPVLMAALVARQDPASEKRGRD